MTHMFCEGKDSILLRLCGNSNFVLLNLMFAWPCIIDVNNVEDQLDATINIYWYSNQLNMFRAFFVHPQERKTMFYSMWYNALKLLPAGVLECGGTDYSQCLHQPATTWVSCNTESLTIVSASTGRQKLGCIIPHAVKHSLALLRMGRKSPEACWADWNIHKFLLLHLVGPLHYLYQDT